MKIQIPEGPALRLQGEGLNKLYAETILHRMVGACVTVEADR